MIKFVKKNEKKGPSYVLIYNDFWMQDIFCLTSTDNTADNAMLLG
jgi:hypothetical protein